MASDEKDMRIQNLEREVETLKSCMKNPCKHCTVDYWMDEDTRNKAAIEKLQDENMKLRKALHAMRDPADPYDGKYDLNRSCVYVNSNNPKYCSRVGNLTPCNIENCPHFKME